MSRSFADNLATLPAADHLAGIELIGPGERVAVIENKPGSQGSLRLYLYLLEKFGAINVAAAAEGLVLYAEHGEDARRNPGRHPNVDRLLEIAASGRGCSARLLRLL